MVAVSERQAQWNYCESHFKAALDYEHRPITLDAIRQSYMAGSFDVLLGTHSALLLTVATINGLRHLHLYLGGGDLGELVNVLLHRAEIIGKAAGCHSILIDGRKGWARALRGKGYKTLQKNPGWWLIGKPLNPPTFQERVKPLTAINYTLTPDFVAVATDTLVTDGADWFPGTLSPKASLLPHLDALITSTTSAAMLRNCFNFSLTAPVSDISELAAHLPAICRQTFQEMLSVGRAMHPDEDFWWTEACAVTLFGWSKAHGRLIGLRFAHKNDFASELLADGVYTHPQVDGAPASITRANVLDLCVITCEQHRLEMRLAAQDRNAIGGDILLWEMAAEPDGHVVSRVQRVHRFDTRGDDMALIRQKAAMLAHVFRK